MTAMSPRAPVAATAVAASAAQQAAIVPDATVLRAVAVASDHPTRISVKHGRRILEGDLYTASSRIDWEVLLRRTYGVDALRCPRCAGRMRVMATITDPSVVKKILAHLDMPTEPLPRARARDPTGQQRFDFDAA